MEKTKRIPSLLKVVLPLVLVVSGILLPVYHLGIAQEIRPAAMASNASNLSDNLPPDVSSALTLAFGSYKSLITPDGLLRDLESADILLFGEAHFDQRDMQTAFEITRLLAERRMIALAVERFPISLQPRLAALNALDSIDLRENEMHSVLQTADYQTVWGTNTSHPSEFPNPFDISYPQNSPSAALFEEMMIWAARNRIPIIGLDLPVEGRESGLGENFPYRNELWKNQLLNFVKENGSNNYLVIAIGGIDHFSNAPESVQSRLRASAEGLQILSLGQRDANYPSGESYQVEQLAMAYQIDDLILQAPQYAVVIQQGEAIYPSPPEYWIAVHTLDSWENR